MCWNGWCFAGCGLALFRYFNFRAGSQLADRPPNSTQTSLFHVILQPTTSEPLDMLCVSHDTAATAGHRLRYIGVSLGWLRPCLLLVDRWSDINWLRVWFSANAGRWFVGVSLIGRCPESTGITHHQFTYDARLCVAMDSVKTTDDLHRFTGCSTAMLLGFQ